MLLRVTQGDTLKYASRIMENIDLLCFEGCYEFYKTCNSD